MAAYNLRKQFGLRVHKGATPGGRVYPETSPTSQNLDPSPIYYVYELVRPDKNEVFYVGKGSDRHHPRVKAHIRQAKRGKRGHKFSIIRKLLRVGLEPIERRVYENMCESDALKKEVEWIDHYGLDNLTNDTPGGQTAPTGDNHWTRRYPEKVPRGEKHPWKKNPELAKKNAKAMQDALEADPSRRRRGERHGMAKLSLKQVTRIRERYQQGLNSGKRVTGERLALDYRVSEGQISRILKGKTWGLPNLIDRHGNAALSSDQVAEIKKRRAGGETYTKIGKDYGVTRNGIFHICNPGPPKTKNTTDRPGNAKLTNAQIDEMIKLLGDGMSRKDIAAQFEIGYSQLWRIFKKRGVPGRWKKSSTSATSADSL